MNRSTAGILIAICLIGLAVSLRVLPHPANFAPVAATAIFGGAILPRRLALLVPLLAMAISDSIIGFHDTTAVTWSCYVLIALASSHWLKKPSIKRGVSLTLGSSMFFFVASNFAVWVKSGMYEHTWSGLSQCYIMALPFFRNTFLSDLIYTGALFGLYALTQKLGQKSVKGKPRTSLVQNT